MSVVYGCRTLVDGRFVLLEGGAKTPHLQQDILWEFPEIRGTLFWGPDSKDPTT